MIGRALRLVLDTVAGQVIMLLVLSIVAMHAALTSYFLWQAGHEDLPPLSPAEVTGRVGAYVELYAATAPEARPALLASLSGLSPALALSPAGLPAGAAATPPTPLTQAVGAAARVFKPAGEGGDLFADTTGALYFLLADGTVLFADVPRGNFAPPGLLGPASLTLGFLIIATTLLTGWAVMVITGPLRRFVNAVESFRDGHSPVEITEDGPREIRAAIAAFNRMRRRIGRLLDDRTKMLAAVSHDLRTPITRLRLRAEFIDDAAVRGPILADLDHMAALTQAALTHLSGSESREAFDPVDLPSLMQTIADQYSDLGYAVAYAGPERLTARVRLNDIQRAVGNLVDNAARYGKTVIVGLEEPAAGRLAIAVTDDGPGIAPAERERLTEPFERGDSARTSRPDSGFGLGLTIARDIAEAHGGRLVLAEADGGGLRAVLEIARRS